MHKNFVEKVAGYLDEAIVKLDTKSRSWVITVKGLNVDICDYDVLATRERIIRVTCGGNKLHMQDDSKAIAAVIKSWLKDME